MSDEEVAVSEAQITCVLKEAEDGTSVGEVCRKTGIGEATFYAWRKKYAGLTGVGNSSTMSGAYGRSASGGRAWVLRVERSSCHYRSCRADQAYPKKRMKEIAETRVRHGYRRIHVLLRREGRAVNAKRIHRPYKETGLPLRHEPPKRRVKAKLREGRCAASCSNEGWAMDFVHDQLATGPGLCILTVVDTFGRFLSAVVPRSGFRAPDVVEVLE